MARNLIVIALVFSISLISSLLTTEFLGVQRIVKAATVQFQDKVAIQTLQKNETPQQHDSNKNNNNFASGLTRMNANANASHMVAPPLSRKKHVATTAREVPLLRTTARNTSTPVSSFEPQGKTTAISSVSPNNITSASTQVYSNMSTSTSTTTDTDDVANATKVAETKINDTPAVDAPASVVNMVDPRPLRESLSQAAVGNNTFKDFKPGSESPLPVRGNSSHPHLSDLRVAFVGDSLSRYMFLSLAAYLRYGRWVDENERPNILEEHQFGDWNYFYNYTNNFLRPYDQCDCYRPPRGKASRGIENRYFNDPVGNNSIYFFQK
jgi:hypothetical protein